MADFTKADYLAAKADADRARDAMRSTPEYRAHSDALDRLMEIEEVVGECTASCEACSAPVFDDDPYSYDHENGLTFCEGCTPSWADLVAAPSGAYEIVDGDISYLTEERARQMADAHVAAGGTLSDKFGLVIPSANGGDDA